jgi:ATPase subunit of ABC transporter with duplicated ATPase domains
MSLGGRRGEILARKEYLEKQMQSLVPGSEHDSILSDYSKVLEELDAFDEFRLPSRAERILEGVGFRSRDFHRRLSEFSGGWLMRVALARVLLLNPDLLILDEPTNHLDLESLLWLEEFLKGYPGAILMVSHDRVFLNKLVNSVWEIDQKRIESYTGDLDAFVVQKEERLKVLEAKAQGQEAKAAQLRAFIERFGAKASKARQAQSRVKQLAKLEADRALSGGRKSGDEKNTISQLNSLEAELAKRLQVNGREPRRKVLTGASTKAVVFARPVTCFRPFPEKSHPSPSFTLPRAPPLERFLSMYT